MKRTVTLLIIDGWGIGKKDYSNPIHIAQPPTINRIKSRYAIGSLQASGIAVGLPWGEEGNSEVGHLTIGAGKVIYQHYPRITLSIRDGTFFANPALTGAFAHARAHHGSVHLVGLLTAGNIHASLEHLEALLELASREKFSEVFLHLFSDGKDSPPRSVLGLLEKVRAMIARFKVGAVASISGRFYAEDRDGHWDRTQEAYRALTRADVQTSDVPRYVQAYYERGLDDPYIEPVSLGPVAHPIRGGDGLIFFDFREDSIRQIARVFIDQSFKHFPRESLPDLYITTMTNYLDEFKVPVAYPPERIINPLGKVLADSGKIQVRIAESEKYAHVTYFMNGYRDEPFPNEYRILIPSKNIPHVDQYPEMMTREISARIIESIASGGFDLVIANFANSDMVAHTGNYDAAVTAIGVIDEEIGKIMQATLEHNAILIVTSDHGNIEVMLDPLTGKMETSHDASLVPIYLVGREFGRPKSEADMENIEREAVGLLADVAPTILEFMGIPKPPEMTGQSLYRYLR